MTYFLEDSAGQYLGDLASNIGLRDLRERDDVPRLSQFIARGQATAAEVDELLDELDSHEDLRYIADALRRGEPPVMLTDGLGPDELVVQYNPSQPRDAKGR